MRYIIHHLFAAILLLVPAAAASEGWLDSRSKMEGPGVQLGKGFLFHPGLGIESGYDTNPLRNPSFRNLTGAGVLRISPYLDLSTRGAARAKDDLQKVSEIHPKVQLRLGVAGQYNQYFTSDPVISRESDMGIDTKLNLVFFPTGNFSFLTSAYYNRTIQPYESGTFADARQTVRPGVAWRYTPGGGTLKIELKYNFDYIFYESPFLGSRNNRFVNNVVYRMYWNLLPRTTVEYNLKFAPVTYIQSDDNENSLPLRSQIGLRGLVTDRLSVTLMAGWGASFYSAGQNFEGFIGRAELKYSFTPITFVSAGVRRDFSDSLYGNYLTGFGGFVSLRQIFWQRLTTTLRGSLASREYSEYFGDVSSFQGEITLPSDTNREEILAGASLMLEYWVRDWLIFQITGDYEANLTDFEYRQVTGGGLLAFPAEYHKASIIGGGRVQY